MRVAAPRTIWTSVLADHDGSAWPNFDMPTRCFRLSHTPVSGESDGAGGSNAPPTPGTERLDQNWTTSGRITSERRA